MVLFIELYFLESFKPHRIYQCQYAKNYRVTWHGKPLSFIYFKLASTQVSIVPKNIIGILKLLNSYYLKCLIFL